MQVGPDRWRRKVGIAGHRTRGRVECRRAVANASAQYVLDHEAAEGVAEIRRERDTSARWLEADQSAARRGDSNRAATVVAMRDWNSSGSVDCRGLPDQQLHRTADQHQHTPLGRRFAHARAEPHHYFDHQGDAYGRTL